MGSGGGAAGLGSTAGPATGTEASVGSAGLPSDSGGSSGAALPVMASARATAVAAGCGASNAGAAGVDAGRGGAAGAGCGPDGSTGLTGPSGMRPRLAPPGSAPESAPGLATSGGIGSRVPDVAGAGWPASASTGSVRSVDAWATALLPGCVADCGGAAVVAGTPAGSVLADGAATPGVGWPLGAASAPAPGAARTGPSTGPPTAVMEAGSIGGSSRVGSCPAALGGSGTRSAGMAAACSCRWAKAELAGSGTAPSSAGDTAGVLSACWPLDASLGTALALPSIEGTRAADIRTGPRSGAGGMAAGPGAPAGPGGMTAPGAPDRPGGSGKLGGSGACCCVLAWPGNPTDTIRNAAKPAAAPGWAAGALGARASTGRSGARLSAAAEAACGVMARHQQAAGQPIHPPYRRRSCGQPAKPAGSNVPGRAVPAMPPSWP